jgi:hypothetical protein
MSFPEIPPDDFTRRFTLRAGNLMRLLGAGVSATGQYSDSEQHGSGVQAAAVRYAKESLAFHHPRASSMPHRPEPGTLRAGAPDDHVEQFEAVYPAEADRRTYLDSKIAGSKPSFGHIALATLRLVPAEAKLEALKRDDAQMAIMIFGEPPSFEKVMMTLAQLEQVTNQRLENHTKDA